MDYTTDVIDMQDRISRTGQRHSEHKDDLQSFLRTLGLEQYYPNKLTLRSLLEINSASVSDEEVNSLQAIPWTFLRKLLMVNSNSRSMLDAAAESEEIDDLFAAKDDDVSPNLLDLHTALFVCADSFLQQELALKMSMCQFAVPFLLPQGAHNPCTLVSWALQGILKEWCPHSMSESKEFVEDSVVHADLPLISFVRLSNCSLSKSRVLNHVLTKSQEQHDFFSHREMIGGSAPRVIANGMVEICWSLPCGNKSIDVFPEPVAIVNLRGDVCKCEAQFCFLTQVSTAVFVFLDSIEQEEQRLLASLQEMKSNIFLVVNCQTNLNRDAKSSIKEAISALQLQKEQIITNQNVNLAKFSSTILSRIKNVLVSESARKCQRSRDIKFMRDVAQNLGLHTDETQSRVCLAAETKAEEVIKHIGVCEMIAYKKNQLPLQGENWKRLGQIEKEQCRLQDSGEMSLEACKVQLQKEKNEIQNQQSQYEMTKSMEVFIKALSTSDDAERNFFLRWMGLKLDMRSRKDMSKLRHKYKKCKPKDIDAIAQLDQELLDGSLGIEHYMRELGLIYEAASYGSTEISNEMSQLPGIAAKLLLSGVPLELLDGDASNIPEKWVNAVLMELHYMVGQKSRLLVLTVLGVQSTGKSTLLNTMFGVQFAVSSGRCTRGASMLFLPVGEDLKEELQCDFVLLIDTEGLKSPAMAQLSDSYEHDNELATFVIGLSDVTIINIAMENSTEMKDVLQIAVHAFLRMKEVGKKTVCHFVHQNVAGVSAHGKNMTDRKQLLEQLNDMTQIAAEMERLPDVTKFTDVLDYDVEKNNWYIPGLWHGTPPMASVNTGYSVAVFDFKKKLIEMLKSRKDEEIFKIPEFLNWTSSLWKAVKFENFIFSFRTILVAHAYDKLCNEFSDWEWTFRKHIHSFLNSATVQISKAESSENQPIQEVAELLKRNAEKEIASQTQEITKKLKDYYKKKDCDVHLVERYKADFGNKIKILQMEMKEVVRKRLETSLDMRNNKMKVKDIHKKQASAIEQQVLQLLQYYKHRKNEVSDEELKADFERMWQSEVANITGLPERDVPADVLKHMRANLAHRNVNEYLQKIQNLTQYGQNAFKVKDEHVKLLNKIKDFFRMRDAKQDLQIIATDTISACQRKIDQCAQSKSDYQETFIKDVLEELDRNLKQAGTKVRTRFEFDLKLHICGIASREFFQMHRKFLADEDPLKCLEKHKGQYCSDFIDFYRQKDQGHKKAQDFVQLCLKPAVIEFINQSLGNDIVDAVLENSSTNYGSRKLFQYTIQEELLEKHNFDDFNQYILHYKAYVKDWIYNHIIKCFSNDISLDKLKMKKLDIIIEKIMKAVECSKHDEDGSALPNNTEGTTNLIGNLCKALSNVLSVSKNDVERVLFQNTSTCDPFTKSLYECIDDLKRQLTQEISQSINIIDTLSTVSVKPQDELFKRVFGCGKQCPFCNTPCEAGGKEHQHHHAAIHRPQGLGMRRSVTTGILSEEICTSCVHGNGTFQNHETDFQPHPYKDYRMYYPDWHIAPDMSIEASDYWKYVLVTFNERFAEVYGAKPAVCPDEWKKITKEQALRSLKISFNIT